MIGGQLLDLEGEGRPLALPDLERIHRAKTGALIVFERDMGLKSFAETGVRLDAVVTYDLLCNIFTPGSPLHDGAVVVQADRLSAAACFLPLTVNPELSRTLGSRHRAAIGVTEDTDAVALVVSEETGTVSLVSAGAMSRLTDPKELKGTTVGVVLDEVLVEFRLQETGPVIADGKTSFRWQ